MIAPTRLLSTVKTCLIVPTYPLTLPVVILSGSPRSGPAPFSLRLSALVSTAPDQALFLPGPNWLLEIFPTRRHPSAAPQLIRASRVRGRWGPPTCRPEWRNRMRWRDNRVRVIDSMAGRRPHCSISRVVFLGLLLLLLGVRGSGMYCSVRYGGGVLRCWLR